jgi:GR25 family glycosyltransferase involved in LPS biosynthesis
MLNYTFYKLFNPDLGKLNNNQLLIHWKTKGINENRISSLEVFFKLYPYYDHSLYKLYNNDIVIDNKIELMLHWHLKGKYENRLCSDLHFNLLYPSIDISELNKLNLDIYYFKNQYHRGLINNDIIEINTNNNNINNNFHITFCIFTLNDNIIYNIFNYFNNFSYKNWNILLFSKYLHNNIDYNNIDYNKINIININTLNNNTKYLIKYNYAKYYNYDYIVFIDETYNIFNNNLTIESSYIQKEKLKWNNLINNILNNINNYINNNIKTNRVLYNLNSNNCIINKKTYISNINIINYNVNVDNYLLFLLKYQLNPNKEIIAICILNDINNIDENYFKKCLSLINFYNMNIVLYCDNSIKINIDKINFLKNINFEEIELNDIHYLNICDYIIIDNLDININNNYLTKSKKVFIPYNLKYIFKINYILVDNIYNNNYFENKLLKTDNYLYYVKYSILYKIKDSNIDCINNNFDYNKNNFSNNFNYNNNIYYYHLNFLKSLNYYFDEININDIFKINYSNDIIDYGIVEYSNLHYIKFYNNYYKYDIKNNIILNDNLYINYEYDKIIECGYLPSFQINIIFIIDNENSYYESNLLFLIKKFYNNYNIIIFLNNISILNIINYKNEYENISIFTSNKLIKNIDIVLFITKLSKDNSLILICDNNYIINKNLSLDNINLKFIIDRLFVSDLYSDYNNILIFKKEKLLEINNSIFNYFENNKYLSYLALTFKKLLFKNYNLKEYTVDNIVFNKIESLYNVELYYNIIDYISKNINQFTFDKYNILYNNTEIYDNINFVNLIEDKKYNLIHKYVDYYTHLNYIINSYKNNYIDYNYFYSKLNINIKCINKDIQYSIFIDENISFNEILNKINIIISNDNSIYIKQYINDDVKEYNNNNIQINIIEFNKKSIYNDLKDIINENNINYVFLEINEDIYKFKLNKALGYNLLYDIFTKYSFEYNSIIFENKIINKNIFEKIGCFDPELFYSDNSNESNFFKLKLDKYTEYIDNKNIIDSNNFNIVNTNDFNIVNINDFNIVNTNDILKIMYNKYYNTIPIFYNFIEYRNIINYNIFKNIKTVIINLEERKDRLNNIIEQLNKIDIYNYEHFIGIKLNENNVIENVINPEKAWKKNDIDYLKSACGCKLSHLEILKKYKGCKEDYILIIEDDAIFEENTLIYLNLALISLKNKDWDILYLTTNLKEKIDAIKIDHNLLKINKGLTTTAQLFKKNDIDKIIKIIEDSDIEIDNTYNDYLKNKYCVYPMCAYQKESFSDINKIFVNYGNFHKKFIY